MTYPCWDLCSSMLEKGDQDIFLQINNRDILHVFQLNRVIVWHWPPFFYPSRGNARNGLPVLDATIGTHLTWRWRHNHGSTWEEDHCVRKIHEPFLYINHVNGHLLQIIFVELLVTFTIDKWQPYNAHPWKRAVHGMSFVISGPHSYFIFAVDVLHAISCYTCLGRCYNHAWLQCPFLTTWFNWNWSMDK